MSIPTKAQVGQNDGTDQVCRSLVSALESCAPAGQGGDGEAPFRTLSEQEFEKNEVVLRSEISPDFIPVDVPINLMIVAAWSVAGAASKTKQIPVVQIMMLKADDDDADPHDNLIEGVQLHLQPRQGQDLGRVAAVDSQLAQVGLQSFPSSGS